MKKNSEPIVHRGDIYYADLSPVVGSEQGGLRPVLVIQNELGNKHAPTIIIAPITSILSKKPLPTHVTIAECGLAVSSTVLLEQIRTIDKRRLKTYLGTIPEDKQAAVDKAITISLGLV
jgi:mRNA interferase MazF